MNREIIEFLYLWVNLISIMIGIGLTIWAQILESRKKKEIYNVKDYTDNDDLEELSLRLLDYKYEDITTYSILSLFFILTSAFLTAIFQLYIYYYHS